MPGVDTASYQGNPNWKLAAQAGVTFAYIKASEGNAGSYSTLDAQYLGARAAGIPVGLYHYGKPSLSPEANADALASQAIRLGAVANHLPLCLDLEEGSGNLGNWAKAFVARLRARTGASMVMVYSGGSFFQSQIGEAWMDPQIALWIAHYGRPPGQPAYLSPRVAIHQYASDGKIAGINASVDLDYMIWPMSRLLGGASAAAPSTSTTAKKASRAMTIYLPPTPMPADPKSDPRTWASIDYPVAIPPVGGWLGDAAFTFLCNSFYAGDRGTGQWPMVDGFLRMAHWSSPPDDPNSPQGKMTPVIPDLAFDPNGKKGYNMRRFYSYCSPKAPTYTTGLIINYAAPNGASLTIERSG